MSFKSLVEAAVAHISQEDEKVKSAPAAKELAPDVEEKDPLVNVASEEEELDDKEKDVPANNLAIEEYPEDQIKAQAQAGLPELGEAAKTPGVVPGDDLTAIGFRKNQMVPPKHVDIIKDDSGYRLLLQFPGGEAIVHPSPDKPACINREELAVAASHLSNLRPDWHLVIDPAIDSLAESFADQRQLIIQALNGLRKAKDALPGAEGSLQGMCPAQAISMLRSMDVGDDIISGALSAAGFSDEEAEELLLKA